MADFAKSILKEGSHALGNRLSLDVGDRRACGDHLPDPIRDHKHLVDAEASPIAYPFTGAAALRLENA